MKVCFITSTMVGGGAERVIATLSNELARRGCEVTILLTTAYVIEYDLDPRVQVKMISNKTNKNNLERIKRIKALRNYFKRNRDVNYISMPTDTNIFTVIAALFLKVNLIISERSDPNQYHSKNLRNLVYRFAHKIVFQTQEAKLYYSKRLQRIGEVIPNPISSLLEEPYTFERIKRIVAVGRLDPAKNHKLLIDAFEKFVCEYGEYELYIYGKGILEEELSKYIKNKKLEEKVKLAGFFSNVWGEAKNSAIYVLSSDFEGMPNSLLEAMAMGLPVIATDCPIGGSAMVIQDGANGLLVPAGNVEEMYRAMCRLASDEEYAKALGEKALRVREELSVEKICDRWLKYMER